MLALTAFLRHSKIQVPLANLRSRAGSLWRGVFSAIGRYQPIPLSEKETVSGELAPFKGDLPLSAGDEFGQRRMTFVTARPVFEEVENLLVTPRGGGWKDGVLFEKYSAQKPGLRMLMASRQPARTAPEGFFIQSEHVDTFGDWMGEYLVPLAQLSRIDAPVFLPAALAAKGYVQRDGARLGVDFVGIDKPLLIKRAKVMRQNRFVRYWLPAQASALRVLLKVDPVSPAPGSLLYLSRYGERSEVADRTHPNLMLEEQVRARGGTVLRTADASLEDYLMAGEQAETLLYDHGSAAYNMVYWRPRRIIEFASDDWWMSSFLFFANASGVRDYTIICTDRPGAAERLNAALDAPVEDA